jgi:gliding motility-associated-like protein
MFTTFVGKNEIFIIRNIEYFSDNTLYIYNRWGEELLALNGYNNTTIKWEGLNKNGNELPEGTYFAIEDSELEGPSCELQFIRGRGYPKPQNRCLLLDKLLVLDLNLWKPQNAPYQRPTSQVQA